MLYQIIQGKQRVIAYVCRILRKSEKKILSSSKTEFLALTWSLAETFRSNLMGAKVWVYTESNNLLYWQKMKLAAI